MAFVDQTDEEKQAQNQQAMQPDNPLVQTPQTAGGAVSESSNAPVSVPSGGGASAPSSAGKAPPVQNLTAYLQANAPQAQGMAEKISANLGEGATKAQNDLASAQTQFEGQIQAGSTIPNQTLIQQAASNPTEFVKNPENVTNFQKQLNASYTGPQNFEGSDFYGNLNSEITDAVAKAGSTNPNDMRGIVQRLETNPTPGMTALDSLVLQQNPDAINTIKTAQAPYATLGQALQDLTTHQNADITAAKEGTAAAAGSIAPAFLTGENAVIPAWEKAMQTNLGNENSGISAYNDALEKILSGNVTDVLGFGPTVSNFENKTGLNLPDSVRDYPGGVYGNNEAPATLQTTATASDYEKNAALAQLLGSLYTNASLDQANAGQAGTAFNINRIPDINTTELAKGLAKAAMNEKQNWNTNHPTTIPGTDSTWTMNRDAQITAEMNNFLHYLNQYSPGSLLT